MRLLQLGNQGHEGPSVTPGLQLRDLDPSYDQGPKLVITTIVLSTLAVVIVVGRIYGRMFIMRIQGWDDLFMVFATLAVLVVTVTNVMNAKLGIGKHTWDFDMANAALTLKLSSATNLSYILSLGFSRASLLLQLLLRLAPNRRMRITIWILFAFSWGTTILSFFVALFKCTPPKDNEPIEKSQCGKYFPLTFGVAALNILSDIVVWLAPLRLISKIKLPHRQKLGLLISFSVGGIVWVSSIVRLVYIIRLADLAKVKSDPMYYGFPVSIWTTVEAHTAIICTSAPSLHPLIKRCFPGLLESFVGQSTPTLSQVQTMTYHSTSEEMIRLKTPPSASASASQSELHPTSTTDLTNTDFASRQDISRAHV